MRDMRNDIKRFFVAVLAACGLAVSAALAAPSYQARLTVQGYAGAELADFPVLVRLSPQTVDGFHYDTCKADGSDVVFVDENGEPLKVGRNDPCPCGSGKKYKKCCGK